MREIKFRVWDKKEKSIDRVKYLNFKEHTINGLCMDDEGILMQYTGLTDKNSKEIYEGDILVSKHFEKYIDEWIRRICYVSFENGCFLATETECKFGVSTLEDIISDGDGTWTVKIIGNIFETPELLKEDEK